MNWHKKAACFLTGAVLACSAAVLPFDMQNHTVMDVHAATSISEMPSNY